MLWEDASSTQLQRGAAEMLAESGGSALTKGLAKLGSMGEHPNHIERDLFRKLEKLGVACQVVRGLISKRRLVALSVKV